MPVRIRLARGGAKKRPFYRIVVADSRRARDGKFIDQVGTYNPMLPKDSPERVKIDVEKTKDWIAKGAQPSDRVTLFLSKLDVVEKPVITEKTKKHLPKKKAQERLAAAKPSSPQRRAPTQRRQALFGLLRRSLRTRCPELQGGLRLRLWRPAPRRYEI